MAESNEAIDKRVSFAAEEIHRERNAGHAVNVSEICLLWDIPRNRVLRRLQGIGSRTQRKPTNTKLTVEQEEGLKTYLLRLDEIGLPAKEDHIRSLANSILAKAHTAEGEDPPTVGLHWPKRYLARTDGLYKVKEKPLDIQRLISHDSEGLLDWYSRFERLRQQYGVLDEDIWNFDETGFRIGIGKNQWIITGENSKKRYSASDNVRKLVTSIEAVSATGEVIQPMLILPGQLHLEKFYQDLPDDVLVGMSESGYSNDSLALDYLYHFERQSARYQKGIHRILVCDGSDCHLTAEFLAFCELKLIHVFVLPPHTTHLLQPLDVVLFQPYKHFHAKVVDQATRTGCDKFNQIEFLAAIDGIRSSTFKRNSIKSAFRECGLVPYDPYKVIARIQKDREVTPELTSPSSIPPTPSTPLTIQALQEQAKDLQEAPLDRQAALQKKFSKGALIQATIGAEAIQQLAETTAAVAARKRRQAASGRQLQKGGVLYSQQARSMRQEREQEEEQKKQDREDRQMLAYIQRMPAEQQSAFMQEMEEDNLERATRLQARLTQRRQQAARRRAETRARNREAAQRELEQEAE